MNKQELINKLKELLTESTNEYDCGHDYGIRRAIVFAEKLDEPERPLEPKPLEPEKPVLTKAEAEWVEGLKEEQERRPFWTKYSALYFITRCGFGYGFSYDYNGREIELKHYPHETHVEKERLANAILYGYEIEKEKLYRAKNRHTGEYLCYCFNFYHDKNSSIENQRFTAEEKRWEELGYWGNDLYVFEEAEGED